VQQGAGEDWRQCSATAVSSQNKSLVITAGHCVYTPDPDGNGTIDGNGY
jgi:V8-like Glu-specific endopeptidase